MKRLIARSVGLALVVSCGLAQAAQVDEKRGELKSLRDQIHQLEQDIAHGEDARNEAADSLAASERAISDAQKRLREIVQARKQAETELARLAAEHERLQAQLDASRKALGDTLYRVYVEGGQAGARRILGGGDPNQLGRDAYYLEQIAKQRSQLIAQTRAALADLQQVIADTEKRRAELQQLEAQRTGEQQRLADERQQHRKALESVADKLRAQRREIASLKGDATRLEKLINGLERIARQRAAKRPVPRTSPPKKPGSQKTPDEPVIGRADDIAGASQSGASFAALRGRLHWPVQGELTGRFGTPRLDGGTLWKGVFIRSAKGGEVRAVADGRVAYSDWLRGFGNLIIIDHGGGYMTIYGDNDALFKNLGDTVRAGEVIASVGATGGAEESGLYFEMRYRGQPFDPLKWMAGR